MLASLPFEVLTMTATFMAQKERLVCATVCKSWSKAFQHSLWYSINIKDEQKVDTILNPPATQENAYKKNGNRVRDLTVERSVNLNNEQISKLQSYFQKLLAFRSGYGALDSDILNTTNNWRNWKSLVELDITTSCMDEKEPEEKFFELLIHLPHLKQLKFWEQCYKNTHYYTWETLEDIHKILPKLEVLVLNIVFIEMPLDTIKTMTDISPIIRMKTLDLPHHNMDIGWLYYISLRYPNIEELSSKYRSYTNMIDQDLPDDETVMLLNNHTNGFLHLKKANISYSVAMMGCLELLCAMYKNLFKSITTLQYSLHLESGDILDFPATIVTEHLNSFPASLEDLNIEITSDFIEAYRLPDFQNFPHVKNLSINILNSVTSIDKILDNFPSLNVLHIKGNYVTLSSSDTSTEKLHPLRSLSLADIKADSSIFKYISYHCRSLNKMCLYEVKVVQKRSESRRRIYMDMLYTNFHVLTFIRVKFFLTTETGSFDEEIPTNFFILGRVVNAPQYFDPNFKNLHSNYKKLLEIHTNYPWLEGETMWSYLCFNKDSKYNTRKLWTLDYKETLTIKKAFEKYSPTDPKTSKTQRKRHPGGLALQRYWRSDLPNGYARILCGHVQGCYFDYVYLNFTRRKV